MSGATLDAGALIAFERADRQAIALVARARALGETLAVPAGAVAQAWRDGRRQARLAWLLRTPMCEIVPLDGRAARAAGELCRIARTRDVVDASVVVCALERGQSVVTTDADDIRRLDASLGVVPL